MKGFDNNLRRLIKMTSKGSEEWTTVVGVLTGY